MYFFNINLNLNVCSPSPLLPPPTNLWSYTGAAPAVDRSSSMGSADALDHILDKISQIETTLNLQAEVNNHMNEVIQNDRRLEDVYDSMFQR